MKRSASIAGLLGAGLLLAFLNARERGAAESAAAANPDRYRIRLFCTALRQTELEPCGCQQEQLGGLDREAWLIQDYRKKEGPFILLDAGGFSRRLLTKQLKLRGEYVLRGMQTIGFDAINIARDDDRWFAESLKSIYDDSPKALLSANVVTKKSGDLLYAPTRVIEYPLDPNGDAKLRVGVIGLSYEKEPYPFPTPNLSKNSGFAGPVTDSESTPIVPAAKLALEGLKDKCDVTIALALIDDQEAKRLAREVPQLDAVIYEPPRNTAGAQRVQKADGVWLVRTGSYLGRYMAKVHLDGERGKGIGYATVTRVKILSTMKKIPAVTKVIKAYKDELPKIPPTPPPSITPPKFSFIGARGCKICHDEIYQSWEKTGHAKAIQALVKKKQEGDPLCLKCHVVGYGVDNGFTNLRAKAYLAGVQCENCHGPGYEHYRTQMQRRIAQRRGMKTLPAAKKMAREKVPAEICTGCHKPPNDTDFDYQRDLKLVAHPKVTRPPDAPLNLRPPTRSRVPPTKRQNPPRALPAPGSKPAPPPAMPPRPSVGGKTPAK